MTQLPLRTNTPTHLSPTNTRIQAAHMMPFTTKRKRGLSLTIDTTRIDCPSPSSTPPPEEEEETSSTHTLHHTQSYKAAKPSALASPRTTTTNSSSTTISTTFSYLTDLVATAAKTTFLPPPLPIATSTTTTTSTTSTTAAPWSRVCHALSHFLSAQTQTDTDIDTETHTTGVRPPPSWTDIPEVAYQILDYCDVPTLTHLDNSSKFLKENLIRPYVSFVMKRDYAQEVPVGMQEGENTKAKSKNKSKRQTIHTQTHTHTHSPSSPVPASIGRLAYLRKMSPLLITQKHFLPQPDCLKTQQQQHTKRQNTPPPTQPSPPQHLTKHMRTILIDWLHEVAVLYQLPPPVLPAAVNLLDRCLSSFLIARGQLQLLGCACLLLESHRYRAYLTHTHAHRQSGEEGVEVGGGWHVMTVENVAYISDGTYVPWEVVGMCRKVLLHTHTQGQRKREDQGRGMGKEEEEGGQGYMNEEHVYHLLTAQDEEGGGARGAQEAFQQLLPLLADPASFTFATTARGFLCTYLNEMVLKSLGSFQTVGGEMYNSNTDTDTDTHTHTDMEAEMVLDTGLKTVSEEVVFAHFLVDLALLDYGMLRFLPSTVAASVLFLARLMMMHLARAAQAHTHTHIDARGKRLRLGLLYSKTKEEEEEGKVSLSGCESSSSPPISPPTSRPFVSPDAVYQNEPWGLPSVRVYLQSTPTEAHATALCIQRLWFLLHDYHWHAFPSARTSLTNKDTHTHTHTHTRGGSPTILKSHAYMFKGLQERYVNKGSARAAAWKEAGLVKKEVVEAKIEEWLVVRV